MADMAEADEEYSSDDAISTSSDTAWEEFYRFSELYLEKTLKKFRKKDLIENVSQLNEVLREAFQDIRIRRKPKAKLVDQCCTEIVRMNMNLFSLATALDRERFNAYSKGFFRAYELLNLTDNSVVNRSADDLQESLTKELAAKENEVYCSLCKEIIWCRIALNLSGDKNKVVLAYVLFLPGMRCLLINRLTLRPVRILLPALERSFGCNVRDSGRNTENYVEFYKILIQSQQKCLIENTSDLPAFISSTMKKRVEAPLVYNPNLTNTQLEKDLETRALKRKLFGEHSLPVIKKLTIINDGYFRGTEEFPMTPVKCRSSMTITGPNVLESIQNWVGDGIISQPVPEYYTQPALTGATIFHNSELLNPTSLDD